MSELTGPTQRPDPSKLPPPSLSTSSNMKKLKSEAATTNLTKEAQATQTIINCSIQKRDEKLKTLDVNFVKKLRELENELRELDKKSLEIAIISDEIQKIGNILTPPDSPEVPTGLEEEEQISSQEKERLGKNREELSKKQETLEKEKNILIGKYLEEFEELLGDYNKKSETTSAADPFFIWHHLDKVDEQNRDLSLSFGKEQLLNYCVNRKIYENKIKNIINENKELIIKEFCSSTPVNLVDVVPDIKVKGSETHNRGQVATKVKFYNKDQLLVVIYFKPRDANIDKNIIALFNSINQLPSDEKSSAVDLPTYKIVNGDFEGEGYSLWEYIDGKEFQWGTAEETILKEEKIPEQARSVLKNKLERLESVCSRLEVSDLHRENLRYVGLNSTDPGIVGIDFESIQPGKPTGLYKSPPKIKLSSQEEQLTMKTKEAMHQSRIRVLPVPTSHFVGALTGWRGAFEMGNLIMEEFSKQGYSMTVSKDELEWLVLEDFVNNDVPIFTKIGNDIFYGDPKNNYKVAKNDK